jgi:hypothetical protein
MTEATFAQRDDVIRLEQQLASVRREIKIRRQVYPTRIATHRMSQRKADHELAAMQAIEQTLLYLLDQEQADA